MLKTIEIDVVKLSGYFGNDAGNFLITFPNGYQITIPEAVFDGLIVGQIPPIKPLPRPSIQEQNLRKAKAESAPVPPQEEKEDLTTKICIDCGEPSKMVYRSGRCPQCALVKCPTCGAENKAADMMGQYCPSCLPREKTR